MSCGKHECNGQCKHELTVKSPHVNEPCACKTGDNFYLGLDDVTLYRGKKDNMQLVSDKPTRYFTRKFHRDPKRAAELVFLSQMNTREDTCDPKVIADFWKHAHYDPKQKMYVYEELLTIGTEQPPKQCQLERFYRGEYEFYMVRHEIQILKTELVKA